MTKSLEALITSKGRHVHGSDLIQCTCGEIYPAYILGDGYPMTGHEIHYYDNGEEKQEFEPNFCPYCNGTDFNPCDDTQAAWNFQQKHIDALIAALERAWRDVAELEKSRRGVEETLISATDRIAELESLCVKPIKLPETFYPDGDTEAPLVVELDDVIEAIRSAGGTVGGE